MINIVFFILSWFTVLVLFSVLILMFFWTWSIFVSKTPFVNVPLKTLESINKALIINNDSIVYNIGSGDGRVLFYLYKKIPKAKYIGIENGPFPLFVSRLSNFFHKIRNKSNIEILKKDFFDVDLSKATHIFTYLYPDMMDDLLSKFDKELKPGTKLVSMSFRFTTKKEKEIIELKKNIFGLTRKIYVYEF